MMNLNKKPSLATEHTQAKARNRFALTVMLAVAWTFAVVAYSKYSDKAFLETALAESVAEAKTASAKPLSPERRAFINAVTDASKDNVLTKAEYRIIKQKRVTYETAELKKIAYETAELKAERQREH